MNKVLLLLLVLTIMMSVTASAQTGSVHGKVHDQESGEELIGANVVIVGTPLGASTDIDGKFVIKGIPVGTYAVRFAYIGYTPKVVSGVSIADGGDVKLDINLSSSTYDVDEVVITANRVMSTEASILADRQKAAVICDGISAEQVKKTPDATSGDALRRVTGISVVDNKFVFIRGITDRYNETMLDGAPVTSTEAGKKSFSFDLLPANLLEYTNVVKSATPDLPGDFTGGLVQLNTLDFPDEMFAKLSISGGYNSASTGRNLLRSQGSGTDWFARDDGSRAYPGDQRTGTELSQTLPNNWSPRTTSAPYNSSLSLAFGDRFDLGSDPASDQLGFIGALSYRNTYMTSDAVMDDYELGRYNVGTRNSYQVLWGGIANLSWKFGSNNKISVKQNYNRTAEDRVHRFISDDLNTSLTNQYTLISWSQRSIYTGQVLGNHRLPSLGGIDIQWRATYSRSDREDPDEKRVTYYRPIDDPTFPYDAATNQRSWATLNDRTVSGAVDLTVPFAMSRIKTGVYVEQRNSEYGIRYFNVQADFGAPSNLTRLPLDQIYAPANFGPGKFLMLESSKPTDSYVGKATLGAGFLMADIPFQAFAQNFRFAGGVRLESWEQTVMVPRTLEPNGPVDTDRVTKNDLLPSLNLTYLINDITNLRLAYYHSVNRPEIRERARTGYYDFIAYELVAGNPALERSFIHNYDIRLEVFPDIGELIAVSIFDKEISGAIEEQLGQSATRTRTWFNSSAGHNRGGELEIRKTFGFLGEYMRNLMVTLNYSRIFSEIEYTSISGNSSSTVITTATRPMQGQSPTMMNLALFFTEPTWGTGLSISYNTIGRRLHTVGFLSDDIYEEPREVLDLGVTQPLLGSLQIKFAIRNLLDANRELTRGGHIYDRSVVGRSLSLEFSWTR
jgi:TonB-dependent receptor